MYPLFTTQSNKGYQKKSRKLIHKIILVICPPRCYHNNKKIQQLSNELKQPILGWVLLISTKICQETPTRQTLKKIKNLHTKQAELSSLLLEQQMKNSLPAKESPFFSGNAFNSIISENVLLNLIQVSTKLPSYPDVKWWHQVYSTWTKFGSNVSFCEFVQFFKGESDLPNNLVVLPDALRREGRGHDAIKGPVIL